MEEATIIKRFECSLLDSEFKKHTDIAKGQYKFFKDQINVINNNREDDVKVEDGFKTEDGEIIGNVHHEYIGDEYKNSIDNIFMFGLMDEDFISQVLIINNLV